MDDITRDTPLEVCRPPDATEVTPVMVQPLDDPQADADLAAFAKAIGHPVRVQILRMLARNEARMCSHIVDELPLAQSTVSEHLRILRSAGLVQANESGARDGARAGARVGARVGYCIVPSALRRFKALLDAV